MSMKVPMVEQVSGREFYLEIEDAEEIENYKQAMAKSIGDTIYVGDLCEDEVEIVSLDCKLSDDENIVEAILVHESDGCIRWYAFPDLDREMAITSVMVRLAPDCTCGKCSDARLGNA